MNSNAKVAKFSAKSAKKNSFAYLCGHLRVLCVSKFPARVLRRGALLLLTANCLLLTAACRRDMQDQPKAMAYRENTFFRDGLSSRTLIPGTVPRGYLRADREFYLGKKANSVTVAVGQPAATQTGSATTSAAPANPASLYPDDVETFPIPITKKDLERGQERYDIFCSVCHGATGNGDGMIARRGFNKPLPASYHQDRLRQAPVGHFFDAMTNGWGAMPAYAAQIPVEDRWRIVAYIRALQLSQMPAQAQGTPAPGRDCATNPLPCPLPKGEGERLRSLSDRNADKDVRAP